MPEKKFDVGDIIILGPEGSEYHCIMHLSKRKYTLECRIVRLSDRREYCIDLLDTDIIVIKRLFLDANWIGCEYET